MKRLAAAVLACCGLLGAQFLTPITGTFKRADGVAYTGSLRITWPEFVTVDGRRILSGGMTANLVGGAISIWLEPTDTATPAVRYTVQYSLAGSVVGTKYWDVPTSASPVSVASIESLAPGAPTYPRVTPTSVMFTAAGDFLYAGPNLTGARLAKPVADGTYAVCWSGATPSWCVATGGGGGAAAWGDITGTLTAQTDLKAALDAKAAADHTHPGLYAALSHTHVAANITDFASSVASAVSTWSGSTSITTLGTITTGTVPWARLSNVPVSFAPAAHTHAGSEVTTAVATATALAANGANCPAGQVAAGVDASGAAEGCTTSVNGTAIPASKTLMATDTALADGQLAAKYKTRVCEIHIWGSGASQVLQDADDEPASCINDSGVAETVTAVRCWANAGSPTVTPIITGGAANSILAGALTCGTASWALGTLNGTPTLAAGGSIDSNVTAAGGVASNIRLAITLSR